MTKAKKTIENKIKEKMDFIQQQMESNSHLTPEGNEEVAEQVQSVKFYWNIMSEEDRDYLHGVQYALENNSSWDI